MRVATTFGLALCSMLAAVGTALAVPPSYTIYDLGLVNAADAASQANRISPGGIVTGRSLGSQGRTYAWTVNGGLVPLPNPVAPIARNFTAGNGANDGGEVVGTGTTTSFGSNPLPLLWQNGVVSQVPLPAGQTVGRANDINAGHVIVGSVSSGSTEVAFLSSGGTSTVITTTTPTGCTFTTAFGISEGGLVVGFGKDPANAARNVGFVYDQPANSASEVGALPGMNGAICFDVSPDGAYICGTSGLNQGSGMPFVRTANGMAQIPLPAATTSGIARGVNSSGVVVGNAGGQFSVPWVYMDGQTYALNDLLPPGSGWALATSTSNSALGISEFGTIVGTGIHNGLTRAYAMVPDVPTAVLLQRFEAVSVDGGVELTWSFSDPGDIASVAVEQGPGVRGPWQTLDAAIEQDGATSRVFDASIARGETRCYRLNVQDRSGAISVLGSATATRTAGVSPSLALSIRNSGSDGAAVAWSLPSAQHVRLAVFDLRGRMVRTLFEGSSAGGEHVVSWDGRSDQGVRAAAGVYFVRLESVAGTRTGRVLLVR
jgi:uncharacterized membrane protein